MNPIEFSSLTNPNAFLLIVTSRGKVNKISLEDVLRDNPKRYIRSEEKEFSKEELTKFADAYQYSKTFQFVFEKPASIMESSYLVQKELVEEPQFSTEDFDL